VVDGPTAHQVGQGVRRGLFFVQQAAQHVRLLVDFAVEVGFFQGGHGCSRGGQGSISSNL
jgi:hypothetical protein